MSGDPSDGRIALVLETTLEPREIARIFERGGWRVRRHRSGDYALDLDWADLALEREAASYLLLHGAISDPQANADRVVSPLREASVPFRGEAYDSAMKEVRVWGERP